MASKGTSLLQMRSAHSVVLHWCVVLHGLQAYQPRVYLWVSHPHSHLSHAIAMHHLQLLSFLLPLSLLTCCCCFSVFLRSWWCWAAAPSTPSAPSSSSPTSPPGPSASA